MDESTAKKSVIEAGRRLVSSGLIARTWGNVSCRIDEDSFVITPSGRPYESLTPEQIVRVSIADLGWEGEIKPSSEKGVHAAVYRLKPEVNFVIHTHQFMASAVSVLPCGITNMDDQSVAILKGTTVPVATYALPGTKALVKNVCKVLTTQDTYAILMSRHGALCFGSDEEESFSVAEELERAALWFIIARGRERGCRNCSSFEDTAEFVLKTRVRARHSAKDLSLQCHENGLDISDVETGRPLLSCHDIGHSLYHADDVLMRDVSRVVPRMRPFLDDFAQIIGTDMRSIRIPEVANVDDTVQIASHFTRRIKQALNRRSGVFIEGCGALFCGKDAEAAAIVARKNCAAWIVSLLFDGAKGISLFDSLLMHQVYKRKYAKLAESHR
ncbi:MAG TPA: class II aldolase/adducin family protein [Spirochaetia bacterium]|nr:class II aldolase/adducin family protein [Spirochaetia bacterium]